MVKKLCSTRGGANNIFPILWISMLWVDTTILCLLFGLFLFAKLRWFVQRADSCAVHTVSPKRKYTLLSSRVLKTEGGQMKRRGCAKPNLWILGTPYLSSGPPRFRVLISIKVYTFFWGRLYREHFKMQLSQLQFITSMPLKQHSCVHSELAENPKFYICCTHTRINYTSYTPSTSSHWGVLVTW